MRDGDKTFTTASVPHCFNSSGWLLKAHFYTAQNEFQHRSFFVQVRWDAVRGERPSVGSYPSIHQSARDSQATAAWCRACIILCWRGLGHDAAEKAMQIAACVIFCLSNCRTCAQVDGPARMEAQADSVHLHDWQPMAVTHHLCWLSGFNA